MNIGREPNAAMRAIEAENEAQRDVLLKLYSRLDNATLVELFKLMGSIRMEIEGKPSRSTPTSTFWATLPWSRGKGLARRCARARPAFLSLPCVRCTCPAIFGRKAQALYVSQWSLQSG